MMRMENRQYPAHRFSEAAIRFHMLKADTREFRHRSEQENQQPPKVLSPSGIRPVPGRPRRNSKSDRQENTVVVALPAQDQLDLMVNPLRSGERRLTVRGPQFHLSFDVCPGRVYLLQGNAITDTACPPGIAESFLAKRTPILELLRNTGIAPQPNR